MSGDCHNSGEEHLSAEIMTAEGGRGRKIPATATPTSPPSQIKIPFFGIQPDWEESLKRTNETAWISVRHYGQQKSTHGDIIFRRRDPLDVEALAEPFEVVTNKTTSNFVTVKDTETNCECSFLAPDAAFNRIHKAAVVSLDVTEGGLGVSACRNNLLKVWESSTGNVRRTFEGHAADVYSAKFFPSGLVVHSCGADLTIKIWSAEDGSCPVTLKGHTAAIQDCISVERGRNIISVSKDCKVRLWDVAESKCLAILYECDAAINSCCLSSPTAAAVPLGKPVAGMSEREIGTAGKLLVIAREDSKVTGISVASRTEVFSLDLPSAGNRVIATGTNTFAVGCQGGEIVMLDVRKSPPVLREIVSATQTPILDLMIHPRSPKPNRPGVDEFNRSFWAAKSDGTSVLINPSFTPEHPTRLVQLTGPDCDPVYQLKQDGNYIYTACRDGLIRRYSIGLISKILE